MHLKKYRFSGEKKFDIKKFDTSESGGYRDKDELKSLTDENTAKMEKYRINFTPRPKTAS